MSINYDYVIGVIEQFADKNRNLKVLDYGCGRGEVIIPLRAKGINAYGADIFHSGPAVSELLKKENLLGDVIRVIKNDILDFPDNFFDLVVCNQVFEHVRDLDKVLGEIARVLKPDGVLYTLFPPKEIILEGHTKIPLLHWFGKTRTRYNYALLMRRLGFGNTKSVKNLSLEESVIRKINYLDTKTFYRTEKDLNDLFDKYYQFTHKEEELIRIRAENLDNFSGKLILSGLKTPMIREIGKFFFTRLAGYLIIATPKP